MMLIAILILISGIGIIVAVIDYWNFEDMMSRYDVEYRKRILREWKD